MVDDAHCLGVLGEAGDGCVGRAHGVDEVPVLVEHLIQFVRPYVYTTAQPPVVAAATLEALALLEAEPERRYETHREPGGLPVTHRLLTLEHFT